MSMVTGIPAPRRVELSFATGIVLFAPRLYQGTANGVLSDPASADFLPTTVTPPISPRIGASMTVADVNADGRTDVVLGSCDVPQITVALVRADPPSLRVSAVRGHGHCPGHTLHAVSILARRFRRRCISLGQAGDLDNNGSTDTALCPAWCGIPVRNRAFPRWTLQH